MPRLCCHSCAISTVQNFLFVNFVCSGYKIGFLVFWFSKIFDPSYNPLVCWRAKKKKKKKRLHRRKLRTHSIICHFEKLFLSVSRQSGVCAYANGNASLVYLSQHSPSLFQNATFRRSWDVARIRRGAVTFKDESANTKKKGRKKKHGNHRTTRYQFFKEKKGRKRKKKKRVGKMNLTLCLVTSQQKKKKSVKGWKMNCGKKRGKYRQQQATEGFFFSTANFLRT